MSTNQKRVLIVEDEKPLAHALELKLGHEGFDTVIATNGEECLKQLNESHFDVVLLDMMMPVMDGFQVLEEINKRNEEKPVIFALSNLSLHDDQERVLGMGARKYFIKSDTPLSVIVDEVKHA
jgi:DNA-binding response OmpR family regulator